jgi:hypothetical protein
VGDSNTDRGIKSALLQPIYAYALWRVVVVPAEVLDRPLLAND